MPIFAMKMRSRRALMRVAVLFVTYFLKRFFA